MPPVKPATMSANPDHTPPKHFPRSLADEQEEARWARGCSIATVWQGLVPRLLDPVKVAILEALLWVEQPLSATEISRLFGEHDKRQLSQVSYHMRSLAGRGILKVHDTRQVRGAVECFYVLALPEG